MKRRLSVTITKVRRQKMSVPATVLLLWCPVCERDVETVSTAEAAATLQIAGRVLDAVIASGKAHMVDFGGGCLRVCKESLTFR